MGKSLNQEFPEAHDGLPDFPPFPWPIERGQLGVLMSKILVVDDDQDSCEILLKSLNAAGHEVYSAPNGREALAKIIDTPPDLVILDLLMPDMDGPNLLEVIRSYLRFHALPVIVWTGLPEDSPLVNRARRRKVNAILAKAKATIGDLVDTVQRQLGQLPT